MYTIHVEFSTLRTLFMKNSLPCVQYSHIILYLLYIIHAELSTLLQFSHRILYLVYSIYIEFSTAIFYLEFSILCTLFM